MIEPLRWTWMRGLRRLAGLRAHFSRIALPALVLGAGLTAGPQLACAHFWYPPQCCNDQDCFKVDRIEQTASGVIMHAGPVTVFVPSDFPKDVSLDNDAHVCVYRTMSGRYRPRCVFIPGMS